MTTFWCYDDDGENGMLIANNLPDALDEMEQLHPGWQSVESEWCLVEVNEDEHLQRVWYTDHTQTAWEAF